MLTKILRYVGCLFLLCAFTMPQAEEVLTLQQRLASSIHYDPSGKNPIGYLRLAKDAPIQDSTYLYVKFAIEEFKKLKVPFVVLDIDSPGGEVFAALKISSELKKLDTEFHIPVVAFIDNWALSAGALLAYSCRYIAITTDASMGAAEPVIMGEGKMESASEKINSALRAEFSNTASFFGRNSLIAEAMVDKDIILVERKNKIIRLESEADIITSGKTPDVMISRKGKLLTLDAKQMMQLEVADFEIPYQTLIPITAEEKAKGSWPFAKCLLSKAPFFSAIPEADLYDYHNSKIDFFAFLSNPLISSLLMMGLMIGIYAEISHPGFGVFGALALFCLSLILLSGFASQAIDWLEIIVLVVGVALLAVEVFLIPGFGVVGILGILLMLGALCSLLLPSLPGVSFSYDVSQWSLSAVEIVKRLGWLVGTILLSVIVISIISRFISRRKIVLKRLVLTGEQDTGDGYIAVPAASSLPGIGQEGIAYSSLRPSGKVLIHGILLDAQAENFFIEKDTEVVVCRCEGGRVVVRSKSKGLKK
ncbi:MAG: hypothetical protein NTX49_00205 [Chlamydiae bacterium]|nr:hypothetical protein [Chlamydiota bacterium]